MMCEWECDVGWISSDCSLAKRSVRDRRSSSSSWGALTNLRWPPAAASASGRSSNPPRCSRSASLLSSGESYTRPWTSETHTRHCLLHMLSFSEVFTRNILVQRQRNLMVYWKRWLLKHTYWKIHCFWSLWMLRHCMCITVNNCFNKLHCNLFIFCMRMLITQGTMNILNVKIF